jgi:hypothetical protein
MFGKILDVGHHRSTWDAVVFYFITLTLMVGISTTLIHFLGLAGVIDGGGSFFAGGEMYTLVGTVLTLMVGGLILSGRNLTSDIFSVLVVGVGVYLAYTSSIMLGLVPIALLTTIKTK